MDPLLLRQHLDLEERHWWFVARRKVLMSLLERRLPKKTDLQVLDAGCGGGATMESLRRFGRVRGLEPDRAAVEYNRDRGRDVQQGRVQDLPFGDGTFDLALALDVIEHVPNDLAALAELNRVLKPGGALLVTVPALRLLWSAHDEANGHYRRYTLGELRGRVEAGGFTAVTATYFNTLLFPAILAARTLGRLRPKGDASDLGEVPPLPNSLLEKTFSLEKLLVGCLNLPFGVSALCLARKDRELEELEKPAGPG